MQRKTVTVLFCDVTGSTALGESLDPEALQELLARYFERMKAIVEHHGGTVEKFIGDAVMAVFGVPAAHEDDALRAARAAVEMRDALPELGVEARIGLTTGEVVVGTEERLATGDAVNVAARLEQAAEPGEVLIGEPTLELVLEAVEVEPVEPLALKGKAEPVPAHRLLRVLDAPERAHETPFVGRENEVATVQGAWARACEERRCELVTIVGDAGVGKTRLAAEALASLGVKAARGRCLPYGEGITYWPVVEVLKQLDVLPTDAVVASAVRSLLEEGDAPASTEEIAWAFRKTLEQTAAVGPVAVVFEDIHWGEETFLDLVEHVALLSTGSPLLLLCLARPELTERRPTWPISFGLDPLAAREVDRLIPDRIADPLRERIARAAGGNPLFIGEMIAMAGEGEVVVPPTLQALLAARLDRLESSERTVLECAAVEGEIFHRGAVQALVPDKPQVTPQLAGLVRKQLIAPEQAQLPGEDGFRFRHLLVRDAAYDALTKTRRADLHEGFARWFERNGPPLEQDELLGYHLEQAVRFRLEVGQSANGGLAAEARERLTAAGRRSLRRSDFGSAAGFLERAADLVPPGALDLGLETDLIDALSWDRKGEEALDRARSIVTRAVATGDRIGELSGRIHELTHRVQTEAGDAMAELDAVIAEALPVFEAAGDGLALRIAYRAIGEAANMRAQMDQVAAAYEQALSYPGPAGRTALVGYQSHARFHGSTPLTELLAWQDAQEPSERRSYWLRAHRSGALAMLGRFDEARALQAELRTELVERGGAKALLAALIGYGLEIEFLAGDPEAAVAAGEESCRLREELGRWAELSTTAGGLALVYAELGRLDDAERWAARAEKLGAPEDAVTHMLWRQARARVQARRGELEEAERLVREAIEIGETTEDLNSKAEARADLGEALALADRHEEAAGAVEAALARFEAKENVVRSKQMRKRLDELG